MQLYNTIFSKPTQPEWLSVESETDLNSKSIMKYFIDDKNVINLCYIISLNLFEKKTKQL